MKTEINKLSTCLFELLNDKEPFAANQILGGLLANTIGPLKDEQWNAMLEDAKVPCQTPHCDCEVVRTKVLTALTALRNDWIVYNRIRRAKN